MHSTIFAEGGGPSPDVYRQEDRQEVYAQLQKSLRAQNRSAPNMQLPSPADLRCTQNADHGVVIPGSHPREEPAASAEMSTPRMPRTTGADYVVHDGEAQAVLHAKKRDNSAAIPKEFWATSVNLQWHDMRHEQCRNRDSGRQGLSAQQHKRQEMSSAIFGQARNTEASQSKRGARQDLLPESADHLKLDSTLQGNQGLIRQEAAAQDNCTERLYHNLADSRSNPMCQSAPPARSPAKDKVRLQPQGTNGACDLVLVPEEDRATQPRRRGEKNFSDLFGAEMGERKNVRGQRAEVLASGNCSFLDSRGEIAARNTTHWKGDGEDAAGRKQHQTSSHLFNYERPPPPPVQPEAARVQRDEGACWEVKDTMQSGSEIARRRRLKDHQRDFEDREGVTHHTRKQELLGSAQVRRNMGYAQTSPRAATGGYPQQQQRAQTARSPPWATDSVDHSAQDRKLASLQSSILF